jgi:hypothetical protein
MLLFGLWVVGLDRTMYFVLLGWPWSRWKMVNGKWKMGGWRLEDGIESWKMKVVWWPTRVCGFPFG